jgi:SH3 domain-containing YSC84-like protein 1
MRYAWRMNHRHLLVALVLGATAAAPARARERDGQKELDRLDKCREVVEEMTSVKEGIPLDFLSKSECVIVIPGVKKAALGVGGRMGWGAAVCRTQQGIGPWGAPLMMSLKGGSVGFQIGGQSSDLVLLVMDPKGIDHLLSNKFTLGADASIAAGPVGRTVEGGTDVSFRAEILSYSRSRGIFAGLSLEGASLAQDKKANLLIYGERLSSRDVLLNPHRDIPEAAIGLVDALERLSPVSK